MTIFDRLLEARQARRPSPDRALRGCPVAIVDVETTGLDPVDSRIVQIAVVHANLGADSLTVAMETLVNPGQPIPVETTQIHGITDAQVENAPQWPQVATELLEACSGRLPVAYNAPFDHGMVRAEGQRHNVTWPQWPWIDPLVAVRHLDKYEKGKSLTAATQRRGILLDPHGAMGDTMATGLLLLTSLLRELGRHQERSIPVEHLRTVGAYLAWQRQAALEQEQDLTSYLAKSGRRDPPDCPWHELEAVPAPDWTPPEPDTATCQTCGAPILWSVSKTGQAIPLEPELLSALVTHRHPKDARKVVLYGSDGIVHGWHYPSGVLGGLVEPREGERIVSGHREHVHR